jgi:hypothetical protein
MRKFLVVASAFVLAGLVVVFSENWNERLRANAQEKAAETKQAKMPETFLAKQIKHLKEGESASVSPDVLVVDNDKVVWLQSQGVLLDGDTGMTVKREKDGFHVEITNLKLRWVELKVEKAQLEHLTPVVTVRVPIK